MSDETTGQMGGQSFLQKHIRTSSKRHPKIKSDDQLQFFQQLTTLFAAGTPLLEGLRIASVQSQSQKMSEIISSLADRVAGGQSLHQAASDYPKVFDRQWIEVIKTGEASGQLADVLTSLTEYIVSVREMRAKLISSLIYPCIMAIVAVLAIVVMLWKVVPTFADFFKEFDSELPQITQKVVALSNFLQANGLYLVGGAIAVFFGIRKYLRTPTGKSLKDQAMLTMPMVGECVVNVSMERFATNMVLLLRSGLPLLETIGSMKGVFHNNTVYREALKKIETRVAAGGGMASALEESGLFTSMMISMVKVGEESGEMANVLEEMAVYYRLKVTQMVERLTGAVEPCVILFMGITVAVILMSVYMPMFQIASGPG